MNLKEFLQAVIQEPKHAGRLAGTLIDMLPPTEENEKLVLSFFESLPKETLKNKGLSEMIFNDFFSKYFINENNFKYYKNYINDNYYKDNIIFKNPNWKFEETVFEYDTLKELLMNFQSSCYRRSSEVGYTHAWAQEDGLKFIENNGASFKKFSKATKKFEDTLIKKNFMRFLLETGYDNLKDFCDTHNVNYQSVIKKAYSIGDTYYGFSNIINTMRHHKIPVSQLENLLNDIMPNKEDIFGDDNLFLNIRYDKHYPDSRYHVSATFIECIVDENFEYATVLAKYFKPEIVKGLMYWNGIKHGVNESVPNEIEHTLVNGAFESLRNFGKGYGSFHNFTITGNKVIGQFENYYNQHKSKDKKLKP